MRFINKSIFFNLLFGVAIMAIDAGFLRTDLSEEYSAQIGRLGFFVIIWCGLSLRKITGKWFTLIYMFELSFYIFTMGQSLLCGLGMDIINVNQYIRESHYEANEAYIFTILCLVALHMGIILYINYESLYTFSSDVLKVEYGQSLRTVGWVVFCVSVLPYCYEAFKLFRVYLSSGYAAAYSSISGSTSWAKLFSLVADYFPFALFMLIIAYKDERTMKQLISAFILLIVIFNFAIGNRSEPICYIMALIWLNRMQSNSKKDLFRNTFLMVVVIVCLLLVIPVIGATRNSGQLNMDTIVSALTGNDSVINTIFQTISDLGYSVFPTIKTMQLIPAKFDYHYGISYLFALIAIIPNVFGGTHISVQYAALAQWLMKALGMTSGPGYSMPAEAYYNFGWAGFLVMPIFGYITAKLIYTEDERPSDLKLFSMVGCFIVLFTVPRRDTLTAVRNLVYNVGLLYLAVYLLDKQYLKVEIKESSNCEKMEE